MEIVEQKVASGQSPRVGFVSLGCPKALVDSERILTQLRTDGYELVPTYEGADVVVVNTCGFIDAAKSESLDAIGEAIDRNGRVIVTGCLGAEPDEITAIHPKVLSVSGPAQYETVVSAVHTHAPITRQPDPTVDLVPAQGIKLTPRHFAYLKIAEGCNHKCRFCIIPAMRGKLVSRPVNEVLAEAHRLVRSGVQELLVISQDTSAYGVDRKYESFKFRDTEYETRILDLCRGLSETGAWIRLHYVYPYPHVDHLIPLMADGLILPYLDVPLQHGSPAVLKAMRRPAAAHNTLERIHRWREICPELAIRSTFIVGYPGETEEDFQILLDFLDEAQLDRVGCFTYSPVTGAAANELPDHVPAALAEERKARFMAHQADISTARLAARRGQIMQVLVDESRHAGGVGRSYADAPEIDGVVHIRHHRALPPGTMTRVRITDSDTHDLFGTVESIDGLNLRSAH